LFIGKNVGKNLYEKRKTAQMNVSKHFQKMIKNISKLIFLLLFLFKETATKNGKKI